MHLKTTLLLLKILLKKKISSFKNK